MSEAQTLFEKVWTDHVVVHQDASDNALPKDSVAPAVLYVDLHLVHEVTSPQAFDGLRARGLPVRRTDRTVATMDHSIPTLPRNLAVVDPLAEAQLAKLKANCKEFRVPLYDLDSSEQGIVHVIGPELGITQPGRTIVCGDSHTSTHGAFGALAFGIGTSEVEHVLATQCLLQRKPKTLQVRVDGTLSHGVGAKDVILALIAKIGTGGATGHVIEYRGPAIDALDMEARMTICNMSIEAGARAGMIAPDDVTFGWLDGRQFAPKGAAWKSAVERWRRLRTDDGATFDATVTLDASKLAPMITYGTNPGMGIPVTGRVPTPESAENAADRAALAKALEYMGLQPGMLIAEQRIDVVFIGSCTNSRLNDLRSAASLMRGRKVAAGVRVLVVPGSKAIKRHAEAEGLDKVFKESGAEWRESGCSMCIAMNGDQLSPGQYAVSTSNRNFEGRQGRGGRTLLASPLTAAASAITGRVTDPRTLMGGAA
jgi:3-isopropylmalate/(R)-2-methylmalate dehydratase large subunit